MLDYIKNLKMLFPFYLTILKSVPFRLTISVPFLRTLTILEWCARKYGTEIIRCGRYYQSSQTCSVCGHVWPGTKDLSVREWTCPECGAEHDRDVNAAVNILAEAKRIAKQRKQTQDA